MVDAITPISASAASPAANAEKSMSIDSEPDNRYVAWRQSLINAALIETKSAADHEATGDASLRKAEEEEDALSGQRRKSRAIEPTSENAGDVGEQPDAHKLSGERDEIGTVNFDDDTPFGDRTAFV